MTDTENTQEPEESSGTCPVCGQEYDHKREELVRRAGGGMPSLRNDAEACKTAPVNGKRTVYVHLP